MIGTPLQRLDPIEIGRWRHAQRFPVGIEIAYKYTLGNWETVEVSAAGEEIPNRVQLLPKDDVLVDDEVAGWRALHEYGAASQRLSIWTGSSWSAGWKPKMRE